jgi:hypothetical protein
MPSQSPFLPHKPIEQNILLCGPCLPVLTISVVVQYAALCGECMAHQGFPHVHFSVVAFCVCLALFGRQSIDAINCAHRLA